MDDHFAGVEVLVDGGAAVHATAGAVEAQATRRDQFLSPDF
ncbi:hypothetical protein [Streptomyces olivochromogenes]|nr:hypothetical protein [Streptomyces olivochromogenes]